MALTGKKDLLTIISFTSRLLHTDALVWCDGIMGFGLKTRIASSLVRNSDKGLYFSLSVYLKGRRS